MYEWENRAKRKERHLIKYNNCYHQKKFDLLINIFWFSYQGAVTNPDPIVRCAAGEALGRIAQAVGSPVFTSSITQRIFDQLKAARDAVSRTGHSVALGCIHRYVGGMASGHHLNSSVSILLALSKDNSSSLVQVNIRVYSDDLFICVLFVSIFYLLGLSVTHCSFCARFLCPFCFRGST